jgi:hypothetical protein
MVSTATIVAVDERELLRRRLPTALVIFALSSAAGVYFASQVAFFWPESIQEPWGIALLTNLVYSWAWGLIVPAVAMLGRRWPVGFGRQLRNIGVHLIAASVLTLIQVAISALVLRMLGLCEPEPILPFLAARVSSNFHSSFPTYWLILFRRADPRLRGTVPEPRVARGPTRAPARRSAP